MGTIKNKVMAWLTMLVLVMAWAAPGLAASPEQLKATGEVKMLSVKAKTLSLQLDNKETKFFNLNSSTVFNRARDIREIAVGDKLTVEYVADKQVNSVIAITKVIAEMPPAVGTITTTELEALLDKGPGSGNYLLIDSRSVAKYTIGHIRTAVSVPYADLAKNPKKYLPRDRTTTIIFYCEGVTCDMSAKSAEIAVRAGYKKVLVYPEGEHGWKKTEYCIATSLKYIKEGNIVLVDLRQPETVKKGHIPRAVNIPLQQLEDAEELFPEYKGASIVFYGDSVEDVRTAINLAREWDYRNLSAFIGGIEEWTAKGYKLQKGPAATKINYVKQLLPHEMGAQEFKKIADTGAYQLIDVRTKEEYAKGHVKDAINVPLEDLLSKINEIPKNKPTLLYCTTGERGEMAYEIIKDKGLDIRYLNATIEFGRDNKYVITE